MTEDTNRLINEFNLLKKQVLKFEIDCEQSVGTLANDVGLNRNLSDSQYQFLLTQMTNAVERLNKNNDVLEKQVNFIAWSFLIVSIILVFLEIF